ncbi:uncharacterized protein FOMMEDRAFT_18233, partial [Fomitiporia mediterranea MF3/22]|uniref:uncharacterized protein n=1 Tax=Fomitiporia mediterranea (strain MF3/22) TaxID=694068 RepID=UPI0004408A76
MANPSVYSERLYDSGYERCQAGEQLDAWIFDVLIHADAIFLIRVFFISVACWLL